MGKGRQEFSSWHLEQWQQLQVMTRAFFYCRRKRRAIRLPGYNPVILKRPLISFYFFDFIGPHAKFLTI